MIEIDIRQTIKSYGFSVNDPVVTSVIDFLNTQDVKIDSLGLTQEDFQGKAQDQAIKFIIGEYLSKLGNTINKIASEFLGDSQGKYGDVDWFDHRHHLLNPDRWFGHDWVVSGVNVINVLPMDSYLLDLCSGDGFFGYYFYRTRAKKVDCIENNPELIRHAQRLYSAENITYILGNVLNYKLPDNYYDVIVIRGAIEHFSQENQHLILKKAQKALKSGGWFCGDTPANPKKREMKFLSDHENEWENEAEMKMELGKVFNDEIYTNIIKTHDRTNLLWRCRKA